MTRANENHSGGLRDFIGTEQSIYRGHAPDNPAQRQMAPAVGTGMKWLYGFRSVKAWALVVLGAALTVWGFAAGWTRIGVIGAVITVLAVVIALYTQHVAGNVRKAGREL